MKGEFFMASAREMERDIAYAMLALWRSSALPTGVLTPAFRLYSNSLPGTSNPVLFCQ